jgi:hypothetical protein
MTVALVTGCSTGIGRAAALQLHRAGVTTVATARSLRTLDELADAGCTVLELDVTDDAGRRACVDEVTARHGGVDVLVNNAGYAEMGPVEQVPLDAWRRQLETNVLGPVALSQLVLPGMRAAGRGRIVNVSSMGGEVTVPGGRGLPRQQVRPRGSVGRRSASRCGPSASRSSWCSPARWRRTSATTPPTSARTDAGPYGGLAVRSTRPSASRPPGAPVPEAAAQVVVRAATTRRPSTRYRVGVMSRGLVLGRRVITDRMWDYLMRSQFRDPAPELVTAYDGRPAAPG